MAAIDALIKTLLFEDNHVVSLVLLFGNIATIWSTFGTQGGKVSMIDATDVVWVKATLTPATRMLFVETIANPSTKIVALRHIGELCRAWYPVRGRQYDDLTVPVSTEGGWRRSGAQFADQIDWRSWQCAGRDVDRYLRV